MRRCTCVSRTASRSVHMVRQITGSVNSVRQGDSTLWPGTRRATLFAAVSRPAATHDPQDMYSQDGQDKRDEQDKNKNGSPAYSGNAGARPHNLLRPAQRKLRGVL